MKSSNTIAKKATNQGKSRQVRTRFSPFATQDKDKDKDKEMEDQDHDKEKDKDKKHDYDKKRDTTDYDKQ